MATAVAALLALAACGGGGVGTSSPTQPLTPAAPQNPAAPQAKTSKLAVTFTMPKHVASKSAKTHVKDINTDVTTLDVIYPNDGVSGDTTFDHFFPLSSCTQATPGTFSCTIAVPAGSYGVQVNTNQGATALGVTVPQTLTFSAGTTTNASFTITPIVQTVVSVANDVRLPADNNVNSASVFTTASDPDGDLIVDPVVPAVFGSITITANTPDVTNLVGTSFTDPGTSGNLSTTFDFTGPEDSVLFVASFSLNPHYTAGVSVDSFANTPFTFPGVSTAATTFVATIAQSGPQTGGAGNDVTYSGSTTATRQGDTPETLNFAAADTFTGFSVTEFNAGAATTGSLANSLIDESDNCASTGITVSQSGPETSAVDPLFPTPDVSQGYAITATANATSCVATFTTADWGPTSIVTTLTITGPASLTITANGHARKAASIKK